MEAAPGAIRTAGALSASGIGGPDETARGVLTAAAQGQPLSAPTVAGTTGLTGQQGALSAAQGIVQQAQQDPNGALRDAAMGYVNNDIARGQIDAATRDVARTLGDETLPGLNARAVAGGVLNSARAGAAEAVARRGAEDRVADISAGIRANAYDQGLQAALTAREQSNALALGANQQAAGVAGALSGLGEQQRQFDAGTRLEAAGVLSQQDLAQRVANADAQLRANGQQLQGALSGFDAAAAAGGLADANAGRIHGAGAAFQAEEQRLLDEAQEQWNRQYQYQQNILGNYWDVVGDKSWGDTRSATATVPRDPTNILGGALGGASLGYGLVNGGALSGWGRSVGGGGALNGLSTGRS